MPRPLVATEFTTTSGDKDTISLVVGGTPGSTTGTGAASTGPITLADGAPATTTNKLYNSGGRLYFGSAAVGTQILLASSTFSTTSAAATNLLTCALGTTTTNTLTALDGLRIDMSIYLTGGTSGIWLRNSTDTVEAWGTSGGGDNLGGAAPQTLTTSVVLRLADTTGLKRTAAVAVGSSVIGTGVFTTNWTGAWTLALRFTGTTGAAVGSWAVYRVLGQ